MIECIFTIDYEIYGNGQGSLKELMYDPAEKLAAIFRKWNAPFVIFVEAAELEMIEANAADPYIEKIKHQLRRFRADGFELGLHIHPWWYKGRYKNGKWLLDLSEYNLCTLPRHRVIEIVDRSIAYLRHVLGSPDFTPLSFRAGHLLFEPSHTLAAVLAERGLKVDSSVYKGGLWHQHGLDYRPALRNGHFWRFTASANVPDPQGVLLELPVHTRMVPTWKMFTSKRVSMERNSSSGIRTGRKMLSRIKDLLRFRYPLKFDLGQMTQEELTCLLDAVIMEDRKDPAQFRPIVAIGHTKDHIESDKVESVLAFLKMKDFRISDFNGVYHRCTD
jgi:hypothetical protein